MVSLLPSSKFAANCLQTHSEIRDMSNEEIATLTATILRLRFGVEAPEKSAAPLFSVTCVARYLQRNRGLVHALISRYFYRLEHPVYQRVRRHDPFRVARDITRE